MSDGSANASWMMEAWEVSARERIRETLARYNHAGDSGRIEELAEQFTPDGVLHISGSDPCMGRAEIVARLSGVVRDNMATRQSPPSNDQTALPPIVRHHVSNLLIHSVTKTEAHSASYFLVMNRTAPDHWGRYRDLLVPHGERWLIAKREVRVDSPLD